METTDRYAPPKASVGDFDGRAESVAPPLWNPNAAANWSLLFTPIFGAALHLKNWEALGDAAKTASARRWLIASAVVELGGLLAVAIEPHGAWTPLLQWATLPMLLAWYFASARAQAREIKARWGGDYPRRGWLRPLAAAIVAIVGYTMLLRALGA